MKIATEQCSSGPEQVEVVTDVLLKVGHEEMSSKVIGQVIHVQVAPHHGEQASVGVAGLVWEKPNQAG